MALDARGIISVIQVIVFVPIFFVALFLTFRHGFKRQAGWIFLLIFSIVRIVGGVMLVVAESLKNPSTAVFITAFVLESAGLSPLLFATWGFLQSVDLYAQTGLPISNRHWRILGFLLAVGLVLAIIGGIDESSSSLSTQNTGATFRKISSLLFLGVFIILVSIHFLLWSKKSKILLHRRTLLVGISAALPFLFIRVVYSALSSFAPNTLGGSSLLVHNSLSKFNTVSGSWEIYLTMSLLVELITVLIYCGTGTLLPLQEEEKDYEGSTSKNDNMYKMSGQAVGR
ncbi:hypothetical protein BD410DRAFT_775673 [Rickenella mellea]|uniref:DUF7702 domain-containing protein n=1 Tax=Rickenella mellea TaxID=50990 RepID=A0A4Y7PS22_9AGAM|nr:hypothetical protein BD410DRAFT_775673 [Rickenella mellea]